MPLRRGATLLREHAVTGAGIAGGATTVHTSRGDITARWVIKAAGLGADWIAATGLTSGMAVAEHARHMLAEAGLDITERPGLPPPPAMPNIGEAFVRPYQDAGLIDRDPEYGRVVCFCERVTAGEIRDAYASAIPPAGLDGLRRRTRAMNGRCQGFYCGAHVRALAGNKGTEPLQAAAPASQRIRHEPARRPHQPAAAGCTPARSCSPREPANVPGPRA